MLTLVETTRIHPVHIIYLGSEDEFFEEVQGIIDSIEQPEKLDLTYCETPSKALRCLYEHQSQHKDVKSVVYGMLRYLKRNQMSSEANLTRIWGSFVDSGADIEFGDSEKCQFLDDLLQH